MSFKLINPNGTLHDFAHKMSWGHNIEDYGANQTTVEFDGMSTYKVTWDVFHFFPIRTGDFIIRNMQSGKIGLYEVIHSEKTTIGSFGPDDLYKTTVIFCGYYDKSKNQRQIFDGYGISKPNAFQIAFSKLFSKEE